MKNAVHPVLDWGTAGAYTGSLLRPGTPTALSGRRLRLLPSGPDRVHGSESRRTQPSTLLTGRCPVIHQPQTGNRPGIKGVSGYRGSLAPHLARPEQSSGG